MKNNYLIYNQRIVIRVVLVIIYAGTCLLGQAQTVVTLNDVLGRVIQNSFAVSNAANNRSIAQEDFKFYKSLLRPQIGLMADLPNFSKTSVPVTQPDGSIRFQSIRQANSFVGLTASQTVSATGATIFAVSQLSQFDNFSGNMRTYNGIPIRFGIIQPLQSFNPWKYRKQIEPLLVIEAEKSYQVRVEEALTTATSLYFNILTADQNLSIAEANRSVNQNLLEITIERLALGKVSKDEKLQLEMELNQAKLSVSQATFQRSQAIADLYTFLGTQVPKSVSFVTPSSIQATNIDAELLLSSYASYRHEVVEYQRRKLQTQSDLSQAKTDFGPRATIQASFGLARGSEQVDDIYSSPFSEQQANLNITVPLVDWGRKKAAVNSARLAIDNVEATYQQTLLQIETDILQLALQIKNLQYQSSVLKEIMVNAEERAKISNERYILGNIDITNLTIAQREKDQAKRSYIFNLQQLWNSYYQLRALTGYDVVTDSKIIYE